MNIKSSFQIRFQLGKEWRLDKKKKKSQKKFIVHKTITNGRKISAIADISFQK